RIFRIVLYGDGVQLDDTRNMFRVSDCVQHHQKAHVGIADRSNLLRAKVLSDGLKIVDIVLDGFSLRVMDGIGFSTSTSVVKNQTTALRKLPECVNEEQPPRDHDRFRPVANDFIEKAEIG